jgi:transposase
METAINFIGMFEQSIGLNNPWKVEKAEFSEDNKAVHIYVNARKTAEYPYPECGKMCERYDNGEEGRTWRHGDVVFFPSFVYCRRPRVKCNKHGIRVVEAPWARKFSRYTLLFESYAMLLLQNMTIEAARKLLRISHTSLTDIMVYRVDKAVNEDDLSNVRNLCIDETSFKRGHSYVTVVSDADERRVIGVEEGKGVDSIEAFSKKLEEKGGECADMQAAGCDMSKAYQSAKELCFPNAMAVTDKFHVKQLMLKSMDEVRRSEQGKWSRNRKAGRKLPMIPKGRMTDEQKAVTEGLIKKFPKTGRAFGMVQVLDDVHGCTQKTEAEESLKKLMGWMNRSR